MRAPAVAVVGLLAIGAQLHLQTVMWLVVIGVVVGAVAVVSLRTARRRRRYGADTTKRLGILDLLIVEHPPVTAGASRRSDRPESEHGDDEIGFSERVAAIMDDSEPRRSTGDPDPLGTEPEGPVAIKRRIAGARRPIPAGIHRPAIDSPAPAGSRTVVGSSQDPEEDDDEWALFGLTNDEVALLFNRYEHLARMDRDALTGDERNLDDEIWLDPTPGEAMPFVDTTRRTSDGLWVYLRSGQIVCKLAGSDVWTSCDGRERDLTRPTVVVSIVQDEEPTVLYFSIVADPSRKHTR